MNFLFASGKISSLENLKKILTRDVFKGFLIYIIPMYFSPIQVPKGALIKTQQIIMIFFLNKKVSYILIASQSWEILLARLLLVFEGLLGVVGGPTCVLAGVVHVGVDSGFD